MRNIVVLAAAFFMIASVSFAAEPESDSTSKSTELQTLKQRVAQLERSNFAPAGFVRAGNRTGYAIAATCEEMKETGWQYSGAYEIQIIKTISCGSQKFYLARMRGNAINPQPLVLVDAQNVSLY